MEGSKMTKDVTALYCSYGIKPRLEKQENFVTVAYLSSVQECL
jgi:hypothetical protein